MKIQCSTTFDITATGITGHFRPSRLPFNDLNGTLIDSEVAWARARNQQRNWETLTQLISLRTQTTHTYPVHSQGVWTFEFDVEIDNLFAEDNDSLLLLKKDCANVPMLTDLGESLNPGNCLTVDTNIWFESLIINKL